MLRIFKKIAMQLHKVKNDYISNFHQNKLYRPLALVVLLLTMSVTTVINLNVFLSEKFIYFSVMWFFVMVLISVFLFLCFVDLVHLKLQKITWDYCEYTYMWHSYFLLKLTASVVLGVYLLKTMRIYYILLVPSFFILNFFYRIYHKNYIIYYIDLLYYTNPWYCLYITILLPYYSWSKLISRIYYYFRGKKYPAKINWRYSAALYFINFLVGMPVLWIYMWCYCLYLFIVTPGNLMRETYSRFFMKLFCAYVVDYSRLIIYSKLFVTNKSLKKFN